MKILAFVLLALAAACTGQRYVERTPPVPPAAPAKPQQPPPTIAPANEEATRAWLQREIELAPRPQPPEPIVQVVERPVSVDGDHDPYYPHGPYRSTFPINTLLGAGIGAIIGHQSGHRDEGAWIGGSVGLLFDATRW